MKNRKLLLSVSIIVISAIVYIFIIKISLNRGKDYYEQQFEENEVDFKYFSSLNDSIFSKNKSCHEYTALMTIKGAFSQSCSSFDSDSGMYFQMEFLDSIQEKRISTFMINSNLEYIVYTRERVSFIFHETPNVIITNKDFDSKDVNKYMLKPSYYLLMPKR